ncbi:MAG: hypothetical protein COU85_01140 [Candidatus Portnoybacteria bacterium CG10_big_fil_rev_8_21_14_0_10_44_7]|uniref:DUF721 domain-containing protein n=1 Tax=Candidatus Portnoybacteria bacterium CG10_big_fil_rev_8_21_14_0_10_44_7 TaxID=1974816 RepID=A0A2M8KJ29_9BACT|nr:MAG: hypothetical protein COU85_01140 [Candidatus Portnoybacteria bacterium CG10_big_fil_rev_8_21_14_0_10_44_7]
MWLSLKKIIPGTAKRLKLKESLAAGQFLTNWDQEIEGCLGDGFAQKSKPVALKNKILVVDCLNSVWAAELNLRQEKILRWIKKKLGRDKVEKIKFIS